MLDYTPAGIRLELLLAFCQNSRLFSKPEFLQNNSLHSTESLDYTPAGILVIPDYSLARFSTDLQTINYTLG